MESSVIQRGRKTGDLAVDCTNGRGESEKAVKRDSAGVETCPMGQFETVWKFCKHSEGKELWISGQ